MADVLGDIRGEDPNSEVFDGRAWIPLSESMNREYVVNAEFIQDARYVLEPAGEPWFVCVTPSCAARTPGYVLTSITFGVGA